ncbi:RNA methyltransferase [Pelagibius sp. Alg239-R121]|uniref:RNA methyltransferase n=1 Tax=Pelagibius sp. Alg239-R121 TaxID=2993448 RepID=UPI0024A60E53|nr:RNA methyltransferase [Pelagibius sp. Alg239-R121]
MAGTDKTETPIQGGPAVILVTPQLGQNIGMVARAMLNCGLTELRLVAPRDGWPNPDAEASSAGATFVLEQAKVFPTTAEAVADLQRVYATTARARGMTKTVETPRTAVGGMRSAAAQGRSVGVLFGPERAGLLNDDIALADTILEVPLNPAFSSLNLAQAVLLIGYEWFQAADQTPASELVINATRPATKGELINFFSRLEKALDESGFLYPPEKTPIMIRNIRNLFQRADLTEQEVNTLHGIISALWEKRK